MTTTPQPFDLEAFGRALGDALGFTVNVRDPGRYPTVKIDCGNALSLGLYAQHGAKHGRVQVYATVDGTHILDAHQRGKLPNASVDSSRDMTALSRDIMRRVVTPGREAAARIAQLIAEHTATTSNLAETCKALMRDFPKLQATRASDNDTSASLYFNDGGSGNYLTGTLYPDGHISVSRLSISNAAKARKLFALLSEEN